MNSSVMITTTSEEHPTRREQVFLHLGRDAKLTYDAADGRLTVKGPNCDQVVKRVDSFSVMSER